MTAASTCATAAHAQLPLLPETTTQFVPDVRLSNETTLSRFAYAGIGAPAHREPSPFSRRVGRLRFRTEMGFAEPYLLLRTAVDSRGRQWVQVRLAGRPNGRTGWVVRPALSRFHVVRTQLLINRKTLRATLFRDGKRIWRSPIGVGQPGTPTPSGKFVVREKFRVRPSGGLYGPYAFGTSAYSVLSDWPKGGVVGVHGTNQPRLIPGRPSHGCVRVPNANIRRLIRLMPVGTPILIL
ncbi:MAG TPA: L,D-transpeptidase [Solirubrobacteraceae bacterium]|nr:L,D-transpeptidase [Solirubrobacteraceae bacterium]